MFFTLKIGTIGFLVLLAAISCSKNDLIDPVGFEIYEDADSIVFAVIGDYGLAGTPEKQVAEMIKSWNPDFIITTGDNNYYNGRLNTINENITHYYEDFIYNYDAPSEYQCHGKAFDEEINRFFPTPGNHDANNKNGLVPYLNFFTLPGKETYYKFSWGPVTFFSLNSLPENLDEQKAWLTQQLSADTSNFRVVYFHYPPYSSGSHGNTTKMQWDFYNLGADIVFTGHDHIYDRIEKKGEEGTYYIVIGISGAGKTGCDINPLPAGTFSNFCYGADYGAIKVTASPEKLVIDFYSIGLPSLPVDRVIILR